MAMPIAAHDPKQKFCRPKKSKFESNKRSGGSGSLFIGHGGDFGCEAVIKGWSKHVKETETVVGQGVCAGLLGKLTAEKSRDELVPASTRAVTCENSRRGFCARLTDPTVKRPASTRASPARIQDEVFVLGLPIQQSKIFSTSWCLHPPGKSHARIRDTFLCWLA